MNDNLLHINAHNGIRLPTFLTQDSPRIASFFTFLMECL